MDVFDAYGLERYPPGMLVTATKTVGVAVVVTGLVIYAVAWYFQ